jgi:dihydrofolate reductase
VSKISNGMRKIIVTTFQTMDGVLQAPGAPNEDTTNGFRYGGWQFPFWGDDKMGEVLQRILSAPYDLLLGRRTYEIFAAHWPYQDDEIGKKFNSIKKYVVATTPVDLSWKHSILISGDVVSELKKLKSQEGSDLLVHGSSRLVQTLLSNHFVDVLHTMTYPLTLGQGKKLFQEGTQPQQWRMTDSLVSNGVVFASYVPDGEVRTGAYNPNKVSDAELKRREKWKKE